MSPISYLCEKKFVWEREIIGVIIFITGSSSIEGRKKKKNREGNRIRNRKKEKRKRKEKKKKHKDPNLSGVIFI